MVKNGQGQGQGQGPGPGPGPGPEGRQNDIITCNQQNLDKRERERER